MTSSKKFQRTTEDFICDHCGRAVAGDGYTNHCPQCLWSRHVDINPGDRAVACRGAMEPVGVELESGAYIITHRCTLCGFTRRNKAAKEDDFEVILKLSKPH